MSTNEPSTELSIGQIASMTRLTIRALRHYDDIGLLHPARVDPSSGYRYYAPEQITIAGTIAVLRSLEISTTTITALLAGEVDVASVIEQEQRRLAQVERQRRDALAVLTSLTGPPPTDAPTVADLGAFLIFGRHARVPASDEIGHVGHAFDELFTALDAASIEHCGDGTCVIRRSSRDGLWLDIGVRTTHATEAVEGYEYLEVEAARTAVMLHHGPLASLPLGHARLAVWIHKNGFQPSGAARETYLGPLEHQQTEIALPISN